MKYATFNPAGNPALLKINEPAERVVTVGMQVFPPAANIGVSKITLVAVQSAFETVVFEVVTDTTSDAAKETPDELLDSGRANKDRC
jgi:hypothetical protein